MTLPTTSRRFGPFVVFALMTVLATCGFADAAPEPTTMSGAVASVDTEARHLEVVTGVGFSLRLVVFDVGPDCRILVEGTEASLTDVKRGSLVVVHYRIAPDQREAMLIEAGDTTEPPDGPGREP